MSSLPASSSSHPPQTLADEQKQPHPSTQQRQSPTQVLHVHHHALPHAARAMAHAHMHAGPLMGRANPAMPNVVRVPGANKTQERLSKFLTSRKSKSDLRAKNILPDDRGHGVQVHKTQQTLMKRQEKLRLSQFLAHRPTLEEIVQKKKNLVEDTMTWTREVMGGQMPLPRNCHSMTVIGEKLYLLGGYGTGSRSSDLLVYDSNTCLWTRPIVGGMVPNERYSHSCVAVGSQLLLFGGFSVDSQWWLNDVHILDTEFVQEFYPPTRKKQVQQMHQMIMWYQPELSGVPPAARAAHSCTVVGTKVYVFAGNDGVQFFNDLFVLDTEKLEWSKPKVYGAIPSGRAGHSATLVGEKQDKLVVFGGGTRAGPSNSLHVLDLATMTWSAPEVHGTAPSARAGHTAVRVFTTCLLVFGGGYLDKVYNDLHMFDVETCTWSRPSDTGIVPIPRAGHTCNVIGSRLYIFGGGDADNVFNDLHILDTAFLLLPRHHQRKRSEDLSSPRVDKNISPTERGVNLSVEESKALVNTIQHTSARMEELWKTSQAAIAKKQAEMLLKEQQYSTLLRQMEAARRLQIEALRHDISEVQNATFAELQKLQQSLAPVLAVLEQQAGPNQPPSMLRALSASSVSSNSSNKSPEEDKKSGNGGGGKRPMTAHRSVSDDTAASSGGTTSGKRKGGRGDRRKQRQRDRLREQRKAVAAAAAAAAAASSAKANMPTAPQVDDSVLLKGAVGTPSRKKRGKRRQQQSPSGAPSGGPSSSVASGSSASAPSSASSSSSSAAATASSSSNSNTVASSGIRLHPTSAWGRKLGIASQQSNGVSGSSGASASRHRSNSDNKKASPSSGTGGTTHSASSAGSYAGALKSPAHGSSNNSSTTNGHPDSPPFIEVRRRGRRGSNNSNNGDAGRHSVATT